MSELDDHLRAHPLAKQLIKRTGLSFEVLSGYKIEPSGEAVDSWNLIAPDKEAYLYLSANPLCGLDIRDFGILVWFITTSEGTKERRRHTSDWLQGRLDALTAIETRAMQSKRAEGTATSAEKRAKTAAIETARRVKKYNELVRSGQTPKEARMNTMIFFNISERTLYRAIGKADK